MCDPCVSQFDVHPCRHQSLEQDSTSEVLDVQQRIESMEILLAEREREMATAQEKILSLTEDLIASQGKVRKIGGHIRVQSNCP